MTGPLPTPKHWKRLEYERLVDLGLFRADPVELIGGQLVVAEPQGSYHATAVGAADDALRAVLPASWIVRAQMPVALDEESAPEPDLVVVAGSRAAYREAHPAHPALAIEVADASLDFDRQHKGSLYARAGIRDYWIVNLTDRVLEVYRDPAPDPSAPYGWRYGSMQTLTPSAAVVPLALPSVPARRRRSPAVACSLGRPLAGEHARRDDHSQAPSNPSAWLARGRAARCSCLRPGHRRGRTFPSGP